MLVRVACLVALLILASGVAGCGKAVTSPTVPSSEVPSLAPAASEDPETVPPTTPAPLLDGQTLTDFGPVWDSLPSGFPLYPGAILSDEAADGPSSGVYVVAGDPEAIAIWFQDALEVAAFSTESLSGPFEDGGFEIDSVGQDPVCRLRITIAPLGGLTGLTTFYGTGCPHD